jgi:uncharacterized membrane protein YgcG
MALPAGGPPYTTAGAAVASALGAMLYNRNDLSAYAASATALNSCYNNYVANDAWVANDAAIAQAAATIDPNAGYSIDDLPLDSIYQQVKTFYPQCTEQAIETILLQQLTPAAIAKGIQAVSPSQAGFSEQLSTMGRFMYELGQVGFPSSSVEGNAAAPSVIEDPPPTPPSDPPVNGPPGVGGGGGGSGGSGGGGGGGGGGTSGVSSNLGNFINCETTSDALGWTAAGFGILALMTGPAGILEGAGWEWATYISGGTVTVGSMAHYIVCGTW